jgi:hypothetical protein
VSICIAGESNAASPEYAIISISNILFGIYTIELGTG